ncbi:MAG: prepilin-type N-terminal cleavage/methylation domain-containing protein [Gallionella sp.]|nr:prepilin-type N-terminal cleavage/methylation domain-containing protein [Gallionella sp.]
MWKYNKSPSQQSGFTLVELAIVLVIIGLILAAVLKGQEMIQNGKVKNVINDLKGVTAAYYSYQDRYKAIPGDDAAAATHVTGGVAGGGDGLIAGLFNATAAPAVGAESNNFWQHTRLSGFLTGDGTNPANNAVGGVIGVQSGIAGAEIYGMNGNTVCVSNIPWKIAQAVDITLDDGNSNTGTVRAGAAGVTGTVTGLSGAYGTAAAPAATDTLHTLCMKI